MSKLKSITLIALATLIAYVGSLKYGFSQDDWYFLSISVANNISDVLNFFNPWSQSGFAFYRPLGTQLYYYLSRLMLGLDSAPVGMHIFMLIIQSLSAYNVYRLVGKLTKDSRLAILSGIIYASSSAHFLSLYYIAATQQLLAALFSLLAINDYLDHKKWRSSFFFLLALLSKEVAVVAPVVMVLSEMRITGKFNLKKILQSMMPVAIVGALYVALRLTGGLTTQSEYQLIVNGSVLSTLRWYYLFGYGAPEELVRYGLPRLAINLTGFIRDYGWQGIVTSVGPLLLGLYTLVRLKGRWIYLGWWLLALMPVIFLKDHRYPHYVDLALIPAILLLLENQSKRAQLFLSGILIAISLVTINLSASTHWTTKRATQAESAQTVIAARHACDYPSWFVTGAGESELQLSYALSLENGPEVICNRHIQVYYDGVSQGMAPAGSLIMLTEGITGL